MSEKNTGGKKNDLGKPRMDLIPPEAAVYEAKVWTDGAKIYGDYNWMKGLAVTRILSALERHLTAIKLGQDIDPFSGLPHAAHIRCDAAMLLRFLGDSKFDDRYKGYGSNKVEEILEAMGYKP